MDFDLPKEIELVRKTVRQFAEQRVAPLVEDMEETHAFPSKLIKEMGDIGVLGLVIPREYGGSGLGFLARTVAIEEISRVSAAVGLSLQVHHMEAAALLEFGDEAQKAKYLPALARGDFLGACAITEPTGGSDLLGMRSEASAKGGGYVVEGRKCFITNSHLCKAPVFVAKTGEGPKGLSAFIVEEGTAGFAPGREERKFGLLGANTGELVFKNCYIPRTSLVGSEGDGMKIALKVISEVGRAGMAAVALGIIQASYEAAVCFANGRVLYGKPIAQLQGIQWPTADIFARLESTRLLCYRASWLKDSGRDCATETTLAKGYATDAAVAAARAAMEIHGGAGTMMEYPVQRCLRDALVCLSAGGTADIGKVVISRAAFSCK
jgi:alkylation response protein AidB-like acyl-CoA dehydrogenase